MTRRTALLISSMTVALGMWLVLSGVLYAPTPGIHWSNMISGIAACALSIANVQRGYEGAPPNQYTASVTALLGSLVIAYSLLSIPRGTMMWSNLFVGAALFLLSWYSIAESREVLPERRPTDG